MLPASSAMRGAILSKLRDAMDEQGIDVVLPMAPENLLYIAGVVPPSLRTVRSRLACCVIPAEGTTEMIVVALEKQAVEEACRLDIVTPYAEFEQDAVSVAAASLRGRGLSDAVVGVETTYLPKGSFDLLQEALPRARFVAIDDLLGEIRTIKTAEEIDCIKFIGEAAQRIGEEIISAATAGDRERDLADAIGKRYAAVGGELTMLVVGAGERSALPNAVPTDRVLEVGDVVRVDVIGKKDNYSSDVARSAVVGEPSREQTDLYATLNAIHERTISAIRPGVLTTDLYAIYRDGMIAAGLPYYHFVGHGLGITLHEEPFISEHRPVPLAPNMVLCIEPMTLIEGRFGMQIEDEIVVTEDGCELITTAGGLLQIGV